MTNKTLKKCIYDLYKQEWIHTHLLHQQIKDTIVDYYEGLVDSPEVYTFEEYIEDYGYINEELYCCYDEFIHNEYQNIEFVESLLKDYPKLFEEYKKDLDGLLLNLPKMVIIDFRDVNVKTKKTKVGIFVYHPNFDIEDLLLEELSKVYNYCIKHLNYEILTRPEDKTPYAFKVYNIEWDTKE